MPEWTRTLRVWPFALTVGALGTWRFHLAQFASGLDLFPGDRGDARFVVYLLEHWYHVFLGGAEWHSPQMFHPVRGTLGYSEMLFIYALPYACLRAAGADAFLAAELSVILLNFLNYLVCFLLLHKIVRLGPAASVAGALFFAFNHPKFSQLNHLQLQPLLLLPMIAIFVLLFARCGEARACRGRAFVLTALTALALSLQLLTSFYVGWFALVWCALFLALALALRDTRRVVVSLIKKFWPAVVTGALLLAAGLVPFFMVYLPVVRTAGWRAYDAELVPSFWSLLLMNPRSYLWGGFAEVLRRRHQFGFLWPEHVMGIGLIPSLACIVANVYAVVLIGRRAAAKTEQQAEAGGPGRRAELFLAPLILATTLFYLIGMKYGRDFSPWYYVHLYVPGAGAIRAVPRYVIVLALPMAITLGFLIQAAQRRIVAVTAEGSLARASLKLALLLCVAFGLAEQLGRAEGGDGLPLAAERAYLRRLTAQLPEDCSSFYIVPPANPSHNQFEYQLDAMLVSRFRGVPTLNGYSGLSPAGWPLWEVGAPDYEAQVRRWIELQRIGGRVCRLEIARDIGK